MPKPLPKANHFPLAFTVSWAGDSPPAFVSGSFGLSRTKVLSSYGPSTEFIEQLRHFPSPSACVWING
jgi:hypothetical protein